MVLESGVSVKEAQELARHSTPELTMNVYGRARDERLAEAVERVGEALKPPKRVPEEYQFPSDLEKLIARWPILSAEIRTAILAIVDSSQ